MSINGVSSYSRFRLSGLATGMDTDQMISDLMRVERIPVDKLTQKRQLAEWKRDDYRSITSLLSGLKKDYLDITSSTNMRSASSYKSFSASAVNAAGAASTVVSVKGTVDALQGTHTISVAKKATAEEVKGSEGVTRDITGTMAIIDWAGAAGKDFYIEIDGVKKNIEIQAGVDSASELQALIDDAFGANKVLIQDDGFNLTFSANTSSGISRIRLYNGEDDALVELGFSSLANLSNRQALSSTLEEFADACKNGLTFDGNDQVALTINGKELTFSKTTTLSSMMNQINSSSEANVNLKYDEINDRFVFTAKQTGAGTNIKITESGSTFLNAIGVDQISGDSAVTDFSVAGEKFSVLIDGVRKDITLSGGAGVGNEDGVIDDINELKTAIEKGIEDAFSAVQVSVDDSAGVLSIGISSGASSISIGQPSSGTDALAKLKLSANNIVGEDAEVVIDGNTLVRSNNTFTVEGVTYTLLAEGGGDQTVSLALDVDGIYDRINKFVTKYNEVIDTINSKLSEEYDRDYQPLTDEQKEAMSDDDIKAWETKAKTGLLRNDKLVEGIVYSMRKALYDSVQDVSVTLTSVGITTGGYEGKGKLVIDETKLKSAIQEDPDGVMNLFSKQSSTLTFYSRTASTSDRTSRYQEEGLAQRIYDVIEDNISIFRDNSGNKGFLTEKAGIIGDSSEFDNLMYGQITGYQTRIWDLEDKLIDKENRYYERFAALEKMISQMNAQSSQLMSQLGMSS